MVVFLAIGSFVLSFEALSHFASLTGAISVERAWIFPLVVDGSIIVFSVGALRESIAGSDTRWSLSLVVIVTLLSMVFNIAHAPGGFVTGLVSAMPPLLLFLSFETLMRQIRSQIQGTTAGPSQGVLKKQALPSNSTLTRRLATPKTRAVGAEGRAAKEREVVRLLAEGLSRRAVSKRLGVSPRTVRRLAA